MKPSIHLMDYNRCNLYEIIKLDDADDYYLVMPTGDAYETWRQDPANPVVRYNNPFRCPLETLLGWFAEISTTPTKPGMEYCLDSSIGVYYKMILLSRTMKADSLAEILGCDVEKIREYYRNLIMFGIQE